ncbi:MAG: ATP-dependent DNA ligase [Actinobacteria bacterium]|nr:ATP-dependent DNA ligase [Actinomycetota bacterium]
MRYADLVSAAVRVAATSKRGEKVATFAELLRGTAPDEAAIVVGLLTGTPRQGRIGVGWATLRDARVAPAAEASVDVSEIDRVISVVASTTGAGSQRDREQALVGLLARLTADEQDHLVRTLLGEMRQGANDGVVTDAVAKAAGVPLATVRRATMLLGDLGAAAERALRGDSLDVGLTPLVAVQPMLAATSSCAGDALRSTGPASVEWKLDGIRVQAHKHGDQVRLFTRGLNEITVALPTVAAAVRALDADDIVLDGESLALSEDGRPRRFQDTMKGLSGTDGFFFDVLYLDGRSLIDEPLSERKRLLADALPSGLVMPAVDTDDPDVAEQFATGALAAGHEGVVVKALDSPYQAGRRGATWRKVKPVHTLDLVVIAAEWGHGRRTGWLSNLHLGARGQDGSFVMVGKTFKGLTDELLRWQTAELQARALATEGITVHVRPELVVEIALDGVQVSRRYPGGVALRFARVKRYRTDKHASEADTIERVQSLL